MSIFNHLLKEELLFEISLKDHYEKYVDKKLLSQNEYDDLASLDPTVKNGQRGKFVEWLIKILKTDSKYSNVHSLMRKEDEIYDGLESFFNQRKGDINSFKTLDSFLEFAETIPDSSKKEKRESKSLYGKPNDIKILDDEGDWIIIETLTQEGNILGAQWRTNPQADWCTAYLNTESHWNNYSRSGDLIQIINKDDPYEKYQVYIKYHEITESRDYKDNIDNAPYKILKDSDNFKENYGEIKEKEPFVYTFDEEAVAYLLLAEYFDDKDNYLNRRPEDEDDYEECCNAPENFQINHWDRVIKSGLDVFERENGRHYNEMKDRMPNFVNFFIRSFGGTEDYFDAEAAKDAVYEFFNDKIDEMFENYIDDGAKPNLDEFTSKENFEDALVAWKNLCIKDYLKDYKEELEFAEYFLEEFPHVFKYQEFEHDYAQATGGWTKDNSDEQLSFKFENLSFKGFLLREERFNHIAVEVSQDDDLKEDNLYSVKVEYEFIEGIEPKKEFIEFVFNPKKLSVEEDDQIKLITSHETLEEAFKIIYSDEVYHLIQEQIAAMGYNDQPTEPAEPKEELSEKLLRLLREEEQPVEDDISTIQEPIDEFGSSAPTEVEQEESTGMRISYFTKKELKGLFLDFSKEPTEKFPINKIRAILKRFDLTIEDFNTSELKDATGSIDIELLCGSKIISNARLVLEWSQIETSDKYYVNVYLTVEV